MFAIKGACLFVVKKLIKPVPCLLFADLKVFLHLSSLSWIIWLCEKTKLVHEVIWLLGLNWKGDDLFDNIELLCPALLMTLKLLETLLDEASQEDIDFVCRSLDSEILEQDLCSVKLDCLIDHILLFGICNHWCCSGFVSCLDW